MINSNPSPIASSQSIYAAPPFPTPPPPPFEYLLELCLDLQVGSTSPESFASNLRSSPSLVPPFKTLLRFLLSTDHFPLSAPLANAVVLLDDETITSSLSYQPASLALAAFLFSLTESFIPSPALRTLRRNAHRATDVLQWPYVRSMVAICSCLSTFQNTTKIPLDTTLSGIEVPPAWLIHFDKWWSMLSPLQHIADDTLQKVQATMKNGYKPRLLERIRTLNDRFQNTLLASFEASQGYAEEVQTISEYAEQRHMLLFLLTEKVLQGLDKVNWSLVSTAYASLYTTYATDSDSDAWWASIASVLARVAERKHSTRAGAMLVIPFLRPHLPSSGESLFLLLHLLVGMEGNVALYSALSLSCRAEYLRWDDEFRFQFVSALLPLPSAAFQDVAASLES